MSDERNSNTSTCCERSQNAQKTEKNGSNGQRKKLHCPQCGSYNFTVTTETSVDGGVTTSRGNTSTTRFQNTHRNFWMCNECGAKFRNIQNLEDEIRQTKNNSKWALAFTVIGLIVSIYLIIQVSKNLIGAFFFGGMAAFAVIFTLVSFVFIFVYKNNAKKMEKERDYLLENCFN